MVPPAWAMRVAEALRSPWALPGHPAALAAARNHTVKTLAPMGSPRAVQMKVRSPV